jgi:O-antigen ligase
MPRQIALLVCIILILYLFWMDRNKNESVSNAIWIPFIWMFLAGSRFVSQWLNLGTPNFSTDVYIEGNPVDRAVFILLIIAGVVILRQRRINWNLLFTENAWIWLYFVFGAISFLYCDYPFVAFKRWVKALGNVIMVLVILTENRPYAAMGVILRRLAFLLLPLSLLFIKYYPELGRAYHMGRPMYTGVGFQKNQLGQLCLLSAIYFSWDLLLSRREVKAPEQRVHYSIYLIILPMIAWLLYKANSATSLACTISVIGIFGFGRLPAIRNNPGRVLPIGIACLTLFGILELAFDVKDTLIYMLGRRPDLTDRVPMWENLLTMAGNPIFGYGYESFWLSASLRNLADYTGSTHNGYLDMYLNLGLVGLSFVLAWIVSGLKKVHRYLEIDYSAAMLRLAFIVVVFLYNLAEAAFAGVNNIWILLLFAIMSRPEKEKPK